MASVLKRPLSWLSIIAATTVTILPFNANAQSDSQSAYVMTPQDFIPPTTLAMMAFRGAFKEEGIPGYVVFNTEYKAGKITAEKIIDAAVEACVLSNRYEMGSNGAYVEDVKQSVQLSLQDAQD